MQSVLLEDPPPEFVQTLCFLRPLLRRELTVLHRLPGLVVPPDIGDHHNVLAANGPGQRHYE